MFRKLAAGVLALACMTMPVRALAPYGRIYSPMEPVGLYSTPRVTINYRVEGNPGSRVVKEILDSMENIPDPVQEKLNKAGGIVVIADRIPFDADDIKAFRNEWKELRRADESEIRTLMDLTISGQYRWKTKEAFVNYKNMNPYTAVHEIGHAADYLLGEFSESKEFAYADCISYPAIKCDSTPEDKDQAFAYGFQRFYHSDGTRLSMKGHEPELYLYFLDLEKKLMNR